MIHRYLEAQQYNDKLRQRKIKNKESFTSMESVYDAELDREHIRDTLVDVICSTLPSITSKIANYAIKDFDSEPHGK